MVDEVLERAVAAVAAADEPAVPPRRASRGGGSWDTATDRVTRR
jgi:hypothetical protein